MLLANAKNMQNDIITSCGVLFGLLTSELFHLAIIDQITALVMSIFIMRSAYFMFMETNNELMDGVDDITIYDRVHDVVNEIEGVFNPHRIRIRKLSVVYVIDLDIEVDGELSVTEAHELVKRVEASIYSAVPNVYDVVIHTEPIGNDECDEKFGYRHV